MCVCVIWPLYFCVCVYLCVCVTGPVCVCVSVSHDLYVSVCLYVCVIGDITYLQATLLAANFITDSRYLLTTLLPYHITYCQVTLLTADFTYWRRYLLTSNVTCCQIYYWQSLLTDDVTSLPYYFVYQTVCMSMSQCVCNLINLHHTMTVIRTNVVCFVVLQVST